MDDDCSVAATAFREYRLKSLPVVDQKNNRKLVGCIRVRRLMAFVMKETAKDNNENRNPESEKENANRG